MCFLFYFCLILDTTLYVNSAGNFMFDDWNTELSISKNLPLWYETHPMWADTLDGYLGSLTISPNVHRSQKRNYDHCIRVLCKYQCIVSAPSPPFFKLPWLTGLLLIHVSLLHCHLCQAAVCRALNGRYSPAQLFCGTPEVSFIVSLAGNPVDDFLFPALFLVLRWTFLPYNMS